MKKIIFDSFILEKIISLVVKVYVAEEEKIFSLQKNHFSH